MLIIIVGLEAFSLNLPHKIAPFSGFHEIRYMFGKCQLFSKIAVAPLGTTSKINLEEFLYQNK